jgi:hypothetical protein
VLLAEVPFAPARQFRVTMNGGALAGVGPAGVADAGAHSPAQGAGPRAAVNRGGAGRTPSRRLLVNNRRLLINNRRLLVNNRRLSVNN